MWDILSGISKDILLNSTQMYITKKLEDVYSIPRWKFENSYI